MEERSRCLASLIAVCIMGGAAHIEQVISRCGVYIANLFFLVVCCQSCLGGGWSVPLENFEGVWGKLSAFFVSEVTVQEPKTKGGKGQDKQVS